MVVFRLCPLMSTTVVLISSEDSSSSGGFNNRSISSGGSESITSTKEFVPITCKGNQCAVWDHSKNVCGLNNQYSGGVTPPPVSVLNMEFAYNADMDGNNLIYGYTMQLSDPPLALQGVMNSPIFNKDAPKAKLEKYLECLSSGDWSTLFDD